MAVTRNTYTGNGSTTNYSFTFPYLEATDIKVSVNGTNTTSYTLANATTIQFNTAPVNGASIVIYRQTDDAALSAQFYPGSAIRSADLNDNFTQNLYVTQESNRDATDAIGYGQQAISTANGAVSTANAATATANTASSNASAAVATANTASSNASAAVSTANTASSNATAAVNTANAATATANSAAADAATAISTANGAVSTANSAVSTANSAVTTAGNAVTTANSAVSTATTASTNASNAVTTANAANSTAANALTTAGNAVTTANSAVSTANAADTKADQAINAVANALLFDIVANVAAIPASPSNNDAVEITNSTGIESFTPLSGLPAGFVGDAGLSVRLLYQSAGSTWTWLQYFPNDPDNRYAGPNTDAGTAAAPSIAFGPTDPNTGIFSPGADEFGIATGGVGRFFIDAAGNVVVATALSVNGEDVVVDNDTRLTDTRTPTDGSVTNAKVDANAAIAGTKISPDFGSQNVTTTGTSTAASFIPSSSTIPTNGLYLPAANSVAISTNSTGRLFINSSGQVLSGTSTAGAFSNRVFTVATSTGTTALELRSATNGDSRIVFTDSTDSGDPGSYKGQILYDQSSDYMSFNTNGNNERLRITSAGLVGIGTSSPNAPLDVLTSSGVATWVRKSGNPGAIGLASDTTPTTLLEGVSGGGLNVYTATGTIASPTYTSRLYISSTGNVGIGTTPAAWSGFTALEVSEASIVSSGSGDAFFSANAYYDGSWKYKDTGVARNIYMNPDGIVFRQAASGSANAGIAWSEQARLDTSGRLLVGTSTASGYASSRMIVTGAGTDATGSGNLVLQIGQANGSVVADEQIGTITFGDTSGYSYANIIAAADLTAGSDSPGRLVFSTTSDSASSPSERLRIASTGAFGLSGANYGSAGQVLTSQGSGAAPQWATPAGGAWQYISSVTASSSATVDITSGINSTYDVYMLTITNMIPNSTGYPLIMRTSSNGGSSYDGGASNYGTTVNQSRWTDTSNNSGAGQVATAIYIGQLAAGNVSTADGGKGLNCVMYIHKPSRSDFCQFTMFTTQHIPPLGGTAVFASSQGMGVRLASSPVNALRFSMSDAANINSGVFRLYGLKNS